MSNQDALSKDPKSDPFLNSILQSLTCELYYRFGSFPVPLSIGLITSRHYLSEHGIKNGGRGEMTDLTSEQQTAPSKYEGLGASMAAKLVIGFWTGII